MWFSGFFLDSVSHSWDVPTMKITDLSILCKWKNLKNLQCINTYLPRYTWKCLSCLSCIAYLLWSCCHSKRFSQEPAWADGCPSSAGEEWDVCWLGLGIENRFRFQNRILKVRNRILVVKLKFRFHLSIPMHFFFSSSVRPVWPSDLPGPCSLI